MSKLSRTPRESSVTIDRWFNPAPFAASAGVVSNYFDVTMINAAHTDLTAAFDMYRVNYAEVTFVPHVDAANSSQANNYILSVYLAEDIYGEFVTPTYVQISGFANCQMHVLPSGSAFKYRFVPRVLNTVDNAGTPVAVGTSLQNPWLNTSSNGLSIPHKRLLVYATDSAGTFAGQIVATVRVNLSLRGII
jgi:hypothetical protein